MNKQTLWFCTLFSLLLVLGVYYVTMPNELLKSKEVLEELIDEDNVSIVQTDMFTALRLERSEEITKKTSALEKLISDEQLSSEEKNKAYNELKVLNLLLSKEESIESKLLDKLKIKTYVEINDSDIKVIVKSTEHSPSVANDIMRCIQEEYESKVNITVQFE